MAKEDCAHADTGRMSIGSRILGNSTGKSARGESAASASLADGALDTLGSVLRVMGNEAFPLDGDASPEVFAEICSEFACHVENGAAVPSHRIEQSADGSREWPRVRRFFADRRHAEKAFVTRRLQDYRGLVDDFVSALRTIGQRDQGTETVVQLSLEEIRNVVETGSLPDIREALTETVQRISDVFNEQKESYENQLKELNARMSNLRQDLVAAHDEMKRDSLTDVFNRGAFDSAIQSTVNMYCVLRQPVTLIMVDIDHFKSVNDANGHSVGDAVLRAVSDCLARSFIRKSDFISRYGGDEFAVILTDTAAADAGRLIDRLLQRLRDLAVPGMTDPEGLTCSIGYTEICETDTAEDLVERADRALYRAKAAGRDRKAFVAADEAPRNR